MKENFIQIKFTDIEVKFQQMIYRGKVDQNM